MKYFYMKYIYIVIVFLFESTFIKAQIQPPFCKPSLKDVFIHLKKIGIRDLKSQGGWNNLINIPNFPLLTITQDSLYYFGFKNSIYYRDSVLLFIQDRNNRWELKYYALALIQGLCIEDYLPVIEAVYDLVDKQIKIKPEKFNQKAKTYSNYPELDLLYLALEQDGLSKEVFFNYRNPKLVLVLNKIKGNKRLPPEFKGLCVDILSGLLCKNYSKPIKGFEYTTPLFKCKNRNKK